MEHRGSENMVLNEFMSRQVRRKQKPEFNPGSASLLPLPPPTASSSFCPRILIIHTSLPLHFISYCCHCMLFSISITICDLFTCTGCLPAAASLQYPKTTPGQPRQFYAHTMEKVQPFKPRPGSAPGRVTMAPKDNEFSRQNVWFNWFQHWVH